MIKSILTALLSIVLVNSAFADVNSTSASASQTIQLIIAPSIQILANNSVQIANNKQSFTVKSNNGFTISVSTIEANQNVKLSLVDNQTEGKAATQSNNMNLSATSKNLIANCNRGNEQTFAVNYKAKNNAGVIYTATQP